MICYRLQPRLGPRNNPNGQVEVFDGRFYNDVGNTEAASIASTTPPFFSSSSSSPSPSPSFPSFPSSAFFSL